MTIPLSCLGCGARYTLPDNLRGKKVRCSKCKREFIVPSAPAPVEEEPIPEVVAADEPEEPRADRLPEVDAGLQSRPRPLPPPPPPPAPVPAAVPRARVRRPAPAVVPPPQGSALLPVALVLIVVFILSCGTAGSVWAVMRLTAKDPAVLMAQGPQAPQAAQPHNPGPVVIPPPPVLVLPNQPPGPGGPVAPAGPPFIPGGNPGPQPPADQFRPAAPARPLDPVTLPDVQQIRDSFAGASRKVSDLAVRDVNLQAGNLVEALCWDRDGKSFYCVERSGMLRRISYPGLQGMAAIDLQRKASWLAVSAEGLLVTMPDQQEAWVLDPETFKLKTRLAVASVARAVSVPGLSVGFAQGGGNAPFPTSRLAILDLKKGEVVSESGDGGFDMPVATPDGKYLFTKDGGTLRRFKIEGTRLTADGTSFGLENGRTERIQVSPDGKYVCLPTGAGNPVGLPGHPAGKTYTTFVYAVTDLTRPAVVLDSGAYPIAVGFDPAAGLIYTENHGHQLLVFNTNGIKQKEYLLSHGGDEVKQYLVHPAGRKLLLLTGTKLYAVELPGS